MRLRPVLMAAAAGLLATIPGAGGATPGDWPTYGYDLQRTGYNPAETTLGTGSAGGLHELWSRNLGAVLDTQPIVASGVPVAGTPRDLVFVGSEHGLLDALDLHTGAVVWSRQLGSVNTRCDDLPDTIFGITSAPVVDRAAGVLYVVDGPGNLYALDLATGATETGWPIPLTQHPKHEHVWSALTLSGSTLYAAFASYCDFRPYHGRLVSVDTATRSITSAFYPLGADGRSGGAIWGWGGASVDPRDGSVYVTTGNGFGPDEARLYAEDVVRLTPGLDVLAAHHPSLVGTDVDFGSTPTLFQAPGCPPQLAIENKSGAFFVYDRDTIDAGPVQRLQMADITDDEFDGMPAWDPVTDDLYVSNSSDSSDGVYRHGMVALHEGADCTFSLAWQATVGPDESVVSTPTVANGVVYYGDGTGNRVHAFDAVTGIQLWSSDHSIRGPIFTAPTVVDGLLLVSSWDHRVHAFAPR